MLFLIMTIKSKKEGRKEEGKEVRKEKRKRKEERKNELFITNQSPFSRISVYILHCLLHSVHIPRKKFSVSNSHFPS